MRFTESDKLQFERDGYLLARRLFSEKETDLLIRTTKGDATLSGRRNRCRGTQE